MSHDDYLFEQQPDDDKERCEGGCDGKFWSSELYLYHINSKAYLVCEDCKKELNDKN